MKKNSFTFVLSPDQQKALIQHLRTGNYRPAAVEHTQIAADGEDCRIALYKSGKCLVQGKGAEDWVTFILEPSILMEARVGYEDVRDPEASQSHMGIDESGKGDFFGPLVIAAAYTDEPTTRALREMNVRDSKRITTDQRAVDMARAIRGVLKGRFALVTIGPEAYNRLYASMRNVNRMLAWGHARAIENLLEKVPDCPRALSDQFGPTRQIEQALMKKGRHIKLVQRPRAESDPAVAAASVLARAAFVETLRKMKDEYGLVIPKGASEQVKQAARKLIETRGPEVLLKIAKCHFKTADVVLGDLNLDRSVLGKDGEARSKVSEQEPSR
ncbi:MAG: ribonuclease HIII [Kiritimatiellae bacterium]|nr:ribonuclease HIII [Kiritimatiellia bacterium]